MSKMILKGAAGKAVSRTVSQRLKRVDYKLLVEPFKLRNEKDNAWRCEFWGKVLRPAITFAHFSDDPELRRIIDNTVADMMKCQTADGCISSYPEELQLQGWDIWGRKYVLKALLRYYELLNPDPAVLKCCCRMVDHLMTQIGKDKINILECGCHEGLAASSILGAIVSLYKISRDKKYREFAEYIISQGGSILGNVFEGAVLGVVPAALGNGKAYEMTSCFQGIAELLLFEPDPEKQRILEKYYKAVLEREIFVTGTGGARDRWGEFWYEGALRQTMPDNLGLGETCITATWMRYCARMLQLTDDCTIADEIEKSLYNSLIGALAADGTHWVHVNPTPLTGKGFKRCADDQIGRGFGTPFGGNDCCRAQGPEGLAVACEIAVMQSGNKTTVNLFEALESENLKISGNYPYEPLAEITYNAPEDSVLRLRTPEFLKTVRVNGSKVPFICGKYLELTHKGMTTDSVVLEFDFSLKEIAAPGNTGYTAVKRGPLVLAEDSRSNVPDAVITESWRGKTLCEYAAAGNEMNENNTLTVWFKN